MVSMVPVLRRNWTRRRHKLGDADAFVVSIPKSGRTWLRFFLRHYLCSSAGLDFSIHLRSDEPSSLPRIRFSHDLWEHVTAPRLRDRLFGKFLIPPERRRRARIVLAVRDLRDVMVSLHLQLTKRHFRSGACFSGTRYEMICDRRFGIERAVDITNAWLREWRRSGRYLLWSYEECRADPERVFAGVLGFLGVPLDPGRLRQSIEFSSFDRMQQMERSDAFGDTVLRPGDPRDPDSYKVRRGVVGGYRDTLEERELRRIDRATARLAL
jgi:hypothetical protein